MTSLAEPEDLPCFARRSYVDLSWCNCCINQWSFSWRLSLFACWPTIGPNPQLAPKMMCKLWHDGSISHCKRITSISNVCKRNWGNVWEWTWEAWNNGRRSKAGKTWCVARSSLNKDSALERGRCSLGVQCLPQVHSFDRLVSSWWCCFGRLKNLQEIEAHWSRWVAGDMP